MKIPSKSSLFLIVLTVLYLLTRLYNLLILPIFTDESIYIYWAKIIATTHAHWFISLTDGKPPLLVWAITLFLKILPSHWYLLAGRLPSVISGFIALIGIYKLTNILFKSGKIAFIASLLYILNPFILLYDRMALFDSLLTSMLIWTVYFSIKTAHTGRIKDALCWGFFLGLSYLSKPTAVIFLILTPICFILLSEKKQLLSDIKRSIFLIITPLFIGEFINNLQRLSHVYYLMDAKNQQFQQPWDKLLKDPFALTFGNLHGFFSWIIPYYTWPIFTIGLISFLYLLSQKYKAGIALFLLWFLPIFALSTAGREIFPRYILFTTPYFLITVAYLITILGEKILRGATSFLSTPTLFERATKTILKEKEASRASLGGAEKSLVRPQQNFWSNTLTIIILVLILLSSLRFDYLLLTNPPSAPLPDTDYNQYVSEHPSGYGLDRVFAFLDKESENGPINLIIQGTFGLYPYAFNLEYWYNPNIKINPRWPLTTIDPDVKIMAKTTKTYILLKEYDQIPSNLPLKLVFKAEKPGGKYPILITTLK